MQPIRFHHRLFRWRRARNELVRIVANGASRQAPVAILLGSLVSPVLLFLHAGARMLYAFMSPPRACRAYRPVSATELWK